VNSYLNNLDLMRMTEPQSLDVLTPPPRRTLAEDIVSQLRDAIMRGELTPNDRLREEVLAEKLGVSRGPIREALVQLEREGLVVKQPNGRAVVAALSLKDIEEVYSLRMSLEQLAVREAIRKANPSWFDAMQKVVDEMARQFDIGMTEKEAARLDVEFHDLIYRASEHRRLYESWALLRPQVHFFLLTRYVASQDFRDITISDHQAIVRALSARDESRAVILIVEHLTGAYDRVITSYKKRTGL
jgi:DNA-binding GntR family transcriptional regulator